MSRIVITLHPNTSFMQFVLNDRMFNHEKYCHSRSNDPVGAEEKLLKVLNYYTVGVVSAEASKNKLRVEIERGMMLDEIIPPVITAIKEFVGEKDYEPEIFLEDDRWEVEPVVAEGIDPWDVRTVEEGRKMAPGRALIGVTYTPWNDNQ